MCELVCVCVFACMFLCVNVKWLCCSHEKSSLIDYWQSCDQAKAHWEWLAMEQQQRRWRRWRRQPRQRWEKGIIPLFFSLHQTLTIFLSRYIMLMLIVYHILNLTSGYFALLLHLFFLPFALAWSVSRSLSCSLFRAADQLSLRACVSMFVCRVSYRIASRLEPVANTPLNILLWDGTRMVNKIHTLTISPSNINSSTTNNMHTKHILQYSDSRYLPMSCACVCVRSTFPAERKIDRWN